MRLPMAHIPILSHFTTLYSIPYLSLIHISSIGALDLGVILPMGVCLLLTVVLLSRGVGYCLKRWYSLFMHAVVGVVLASTVVILPPVKLLISPGYTFAMGLGDWLIYAGCFAAGAVLAWALGKVQGKE